MGVHLGAQRTPQLSVGFRGSRRNAPEESDLDDLSPLSKAEAALGDGAVWLAAQMEAFQAAVRGAPLDVALGILARAALKIAMVSSPVSSAPVREGASRTSFALCGHQTSAYAGLEKQLSRCWTKWAGYHELAASGEM